jgi:hypothetical protein
MVDNIDEILESKEAKNLEEAFKDVTQEARDKIRETLNESGNFIACHTWVKKLEDVTPDSGNYCGCLMMDGFGKNFTEADWVRWHTAISESSDDFMGQLMDLYQMLDYDDAVLIDLAGAYDTAGWKFKDDLLEEYDRKFLYSDSDKNARYEGILNATGRKVVLAILDRAEGVNATA